MAMDKYPEITFAVKNKFNKLSTDKLTPWVFLNAGKMRPVEDFYGNSIQYQGVGFEGSPREVLWGGFIEPFLEDIFVWAFDFALEYAKKRNIDRQEPILYTHQCLLNGLHSIYSRMQNIDRRLSGKGYPDQVSPRDISREAQKMQIKLDEYRDSTLAATNIKNVPNECGPLAKEKCDRSDEIEKKRSPRRVFLDIPYSDYDDCEKIIVEILKELELEPVIAKDKVTSSAVLCKICEEMQKCKYGISDISSGSNSVSYEYGLMHGLGMKVCLLLRDEEVKFSDIDGLEHHSYSGLRSFKIKLIKWVQQNISEINLIKASEMLSLEKSLILSKGDLPLIKISHFWDKQNGQVGGSAELSSETKELLGAAVKDVSGIIMKMWIKNGLHISTNGHVFGMTGTAEGDAVWEDALNQLESRQLIVPTAGKGGYRLTKLGYEEAKSGSGSALNQEPSIAIEQCSIIKKLESTQERHVYRLTLTVKNVGIKTIKGITFDLEFPGGIPVLSDINNILDVKGPGRAAKLNVLFEDAIKRFPDILPGKDFTFACFDFEINNRVYQEGWTRKKIIYTFYADDMPPRVKEELLEGKNIDGSDRINF